VRRGLDPRIHPLDAWSAAAAPAPSQKGLIYSGFLAVTFHELESIMIPSGR
jgi:hypothetical protein